MADNDNTKPLFHAFQAVAEHCMADEVAVAAATLAASALCDDSTTLVEAEIKAGVLCDLLKANLRSNWIKLYGASGERYVIAK